MAWETTGNGGTVPETDFLGTTDDQPLVIRTNNAEAVRINADPAASKLEINAQDGLAIVGFQPFLTLRDANAGNAGCAVQGVEGDIVFIPQSFLGSGAAMVVKTESGNVGIGTSQPTSKVEIAAQDGLAISGFQPFLTLRDGNAGNARSVVQGVNGDLVFIPHSFIGGGAAMVVKTGSGNVGIGTATPRQKLQVVGTVLAHDVELSNADCAEEFDVDPSEPVEPGTVMVLGKEGTLECSRQPYDKRVAGVISGAGDFKPGLVLDKQESRPARTPVALLGKVFCKVDATFAPIEVGDLLTTSPTPGHGMKATDAAKAFGAVIGKALRALDGGQGLIPVLVALQ